MLIIQLGLNFIRTSPDHGTAHDIAGHDKANPQSLRTALFNAIDLVKNRLAYKERTANPLHHQKYTGNLEESSEEEK